MAILVTGGSGYVGLNVVEALAAAGREVVSFDMTLAPPAAGAAPGKPMTALQAALFQWVNPKAWIIAAGAVATYTGGEGGLAGQALALAALFGLGFLLLALREARAAVGNSVGNRAGEQAGNGPRTRTR
jgi:nucleoside-diphosphate-sugar epimerase